MRVNKIENINKTPNSPLTADYNSESDRQRRQEDNQKLMIGYEAGYDLKLQSGDPDQTKAERVEQAKKNTEFAKKQGFSAVLAEEIRKVKK